MADENGGLTLKEWVARLDGKLDAFASTKADRIDIERLQTQVNEIEHAIHKVSSHLNEQVALSGYRSKLWKVAGALVGSAASLSLILYYVFPLHK